LTGDDAEQQERDSMRNTKRSRPRRAAARNERAYSVDANVAHSVEGDATQSASGRADSPGDESATIVADLIGQIFGSNRVALGALRGGPLSLRVMKKQFVQHFERVYIEQLLSSCEGNVTMAARRAQKHRRAFFALMRKHGIDPARYRSGDAGEERAVQG
jgi:DNA-binding NtrC family response regulator